MDPVLLGQLKTVSKSVINIKVNGFPADALIDTGSSNIFMSKSFADRLKFEITPGVGKISMASTNLQSSINGYCVLQSRILNHQYNSILPFTFMC